jgi:hypothetical protein
MAKPHVTHLMALHDASVPHWESAARWSVAVALGVHCNTQYFLPAELCSAHFGSAAAVAGLSLGHLPSLHGLEHTAPPTPVMVMLTSSVSQGALYGSP